MNEIILEIATFLQVTPTDVEILAFVVVFIGFFLALGIQKTYEAFFGLVVGLAIYLMLTVLLSPQYQTPDTIKFFGPGLSNFLVGSAAYLIFILMLLTPLSWGVKIPYPKHPVVRILSNVFVSVALLVFLSALILGFTSKKYVFGIETAFALLIKTDTYSLLLHTKIVGWIVRQLQPIVLFSVLFMLYQLLFAEMVGTLMIALGAWLRSLKNRNSTGHEAHGEHESHEAHGHEEELIDFDLEPSHDAHGHGGDHGHH